MSISIGGWGYGASISTGGWGGFFSDDYLLTILAEFVGSEAHKCIITREYVEVAIRSTGQIIFRRRMDDVPIRGGVDCMPIPQ